MNDTVQPQWVEHLPLTPPEAPSTPKEEVIKEEKKEVRE